MSEDIRIVDVLSTRLDETTKRVVACVGDVNGQGQTESEGVRVIQQWGFASRPSKPDANQKKAAQAIVVSSGGAENAIAGQDLRSLPIYGSLAEGETCIYAAGETGSAQARVLLKANGSINLYTVAGNASGGKSMGVFIHPDGSINLTAPSGNAVLIGDDGSIKIFNGSGGVQIKADGSIKIAGSSQVAVSAGSVAIGGPAGLPIAIAPQTVTAITALQTQITALQAEIAAISTTMGVIEAANAASFTAIVAVPPLTAVAANIATDAGIVTGALAGLGVTVGTTSGAMAAQTATVGAQSALIPSLRTTSD